MPSEKKTKRRSIAPAEGERRAISGYISQYRVAASLILQKLREGSLSWIKVADPEAGQVDDFQIGSQHRIDAFQIKSTQYDNNFSFNDLVTAKANERSLIAQLANGWVLLRKKYSDRRIVVHLITNQIPSPNAKLPVGVPPPTPKHFAAFLEQVWKPARTTFSDAPDVPISWKPAWEKLQMASGLSVENFNVFVKDCELEFGYKLPDFKAASSQEERSLQTDLKKLVDWLYSAVSDPARVIEFSKDDLISELGWRDRVEFRSRHEFPEPEIPYSPIQSSVERLDRALSELPGGYILIIGTPGSGKSTLLTKTFRYRPERVIRYYAYVPDAQDPISLRGESINFLHDVILAIEQAGFSAHENFNQFDRIQLLRRFHKQLQLLHYDWKETGRKTVIHIDGLDHISREQHPERSLLQDLPLPEQIPDGVYIVLGSQTDDLADIPDRVQYSIRQTERRVDMQPLTKEEVYNITTQTVLQLALGEEEKEQVYSLSGGHPLALVLILTVLRNATDQKTAKDLLQRTERYGGDIEAQYHSYWREFESDSELINLLGLLVRLRRDIDISWVKTWADNNVLSRLCRKLERYFRIENNHHWYFPHNSFRLFLLRKTSELSPGNIDPEKDISFHRKLAELCAGMSVDSLWAWEELYHWLSAGEYDKVLNKATREWFHDQLEAFRPIDAIRADINHALRAAGAKNDPIAFSRIILIGSEIAQREFYLERTSFIYLLVQLDKKHIAAEYIRNGNRLRVYTGAALGLSQDLRDAGLIEEARRVFELAEPLDLLASTKPIEQDAQDEKGSLLEIWAEAAVCYRDIERIIKIIRGIQKIPAHHEQLDAKVATIYLHNRLLFHAGLKLMEQERWESLDQLKKEFDLSRADDLDWWFWLQVRSWRKCHLVGNNERAKYFLEETLQNPDLQSLDDKANTILAEDIFRILGNADLARKYIQNTPQPELRTNIYSTGNGFHTFNQRFRLNRLLYALGEEKSPTDIIPNPDNSRHWGMTYFERGLCIIAQIWAKAWRGVKLEGSTIATEAFALLRLFHRRWGEKRDWDSWYVAEEARSDFYKLLIDATSQHGIEAIVLLAEALEKEWNSINTGKYWPSDVRRQCILALWQGGIRKDWVIEKLKEIEQHMHEGQDISGRIDECRNQAKAWLSLREPEFASAALRQMIKVSFGVGYRKDYQFDGWIRWLGRINQAEPEQASQRIAWFAQAVISLQGSTEGKTSRYAANELLAVTFRWSPRSANDLFYWFVDKGIVWFEEAIRILIEELLNSSNAQPVIAFYALADFNLPIATQADEDLATLLIKQINAYHGRDRALELAIYFVQKVETYALSSTRLLWRRGVARGLQELGIDLDKAGLEASDLKRNPEEEHSSVKLKLKSDSEIHFDDEIVGQISTIEDLKKLLDDEDSNSYFDWKPVAAQMAKNRNIEGIQALASLFRTKKDSASVLAKLSEALSQLGDMRGAWDLGEQALEASTPAGWDRYWDGGSRIDAFKAIVKADPIKGRQLAFQTIVHDVTTESPYPQNIARNLDKILPILAGEIPLQEIWPEIEKYIHAMFAGCQMSEGESVRFRDYKEDTPSRALTDLIAYHLDHPVNAVAKSAQRACASLLLEYDQAMQDAILACLESSESLQESSLVVLDAVSIEKPDALSLFQNSIAGLRQSPNYAIRYIANKVGKRIGLEPAPLRSQAAQLPSIYSLILPKEDVSNLIQEPEIAAGEVLPHSVDPLEILALYDIHIEHIAEEAKLPEINLYYRVYQIMKELAPEETWSAEGERHILDMLESISLRLPYRRPRATIGRRAIFRMVAELLDNGVLKERNLYRLAPIFRFYDPRMVLSNPGLRPRGINTTVGKSRHVSINREIDEKETEQDRGGIKQIYKVTSSGDVVIAENTKLKQLEWETPKENRLSVVCQSGTVYENTEYNAALFFDGVINCLIDEYPRTIIDEDTIPLAIYHNGLGYDTPGANWLALNPAIGYQLGWNTTDEGLFRWVNEKGQLMVESIWWVDGPIDETPPHLHDEVGEGWLVIGSPQAWNEIAARFSPLKRVMYIERGYYENKQWMSSQDFLEESL